MNLLLPEVHAAGDSFAKVKVLRALRQSAGRLAAASAWGSFAAHGERLEGVELVVVDRFPKSLKWSNGVLEDAELLLGTLHPNLVVVRDLIDDPDAVVVVSDFLDAERLDDLRRAKETMPIEIGLRALVDVLSALSAVHGVKNGFVHGQVTASNVLVGLDGVTRLARSFMGLARDEGVDPPSIGYLAPELLRGDPIDARADVYSAGVLLWEMISQKRLFAGATKASLIASSGKPRPKAVPPPSATWAASLADVADKAMSSDPAARYATASEMAAAVRLIVRARLAMAPKVASFVERAAGARIMSRRATLAVPADRQVRHSRPPVAAPSPAAPAVTPVHEPLPPPAPALPPAQPPSLLELEIDSDALIDAPDSRPLAPEPKTEIAPPIPSVIAPMEGSLDAVARAEVTQRRRRDRPKVIYGLVGSVAAIIVLGGVGVMVKALRHVDPAPARSVATVDPPDPPPALSTASTAPAIVAPSTSTPVIAAPSASPPSSASSTAPRPSRPRPKSTYDPEGI